MIAKTYRKLIAKQTGQDFKSAIEIVEVSIREPLAHEILIRNQFAGVNGGFDTLLCRGEVPYVNLAPPFDLGVEAVGEVVAVGNSVAKFKVGDAVATAMRGGGYREYQTIDAKLAVKIPKATPEILTLVSTGVSAVVGLEKAGQMLGEEVVMVTAAAGGAGHIAMQWAKMAGNHVIGTCGSDAKARLLKELGCDRVINYKLENVNEVLQKEYPNGVDLVFECVGKEMFDICVDNLARRGRLLVFGFVSEYGNSLEKLEQPRIYGKLFWKAASVRGFLMPLYSEYVPEVREKLIEKFLQGSLKVIVNSDEFRGLESIPTAVEYLLGGQNCGKVVVRF